MQAKFPQSISNITVWPAIILGLIWWVTGWVCIDWVLNYSVYHGMTELWLIQVPFTSIDVVASPWQAYFLSFIQIHVALVLLIYGMKKVLK
jgi:hypothetical protein